MRLLDGLVECHGPSSISQAILALPAKIAAVVQVLCLEKGTLNMQ